MTLKRGDYHPSIVASLYSLLIATALFFVGFIAMHENIRVALASVYMATPFLASAPLCAIYGMCVGHVKHGLLLLAAMSLGLGIYSWTLFGMTPLADRGLQRQIEQQMRQFMHP